MTPETIASTIKEHRGRQIEGIVPYKAFRKLVQDCQQDWEQPALECLGGVAKDFLKYLEEKIKYIFKAYPPFASEIT